MPNNKCPKCGEGLVEHWMFNYDIIKEGNFKVKSCVNKKCEGWWCPACDTWHPYGTTCANYEVGRVRGKY